MFCLHNNHQQFVQQERSWHAALFLQNKIGSFSEEIMTHLICLGRNKKVIDCFLRDKEALDFFLKY
jgi:hypothetical protein